ncbi:hypothetical protein [Mariniplasma anaerobium]|uniref:Uncharacterized protein n=1 Tax=Mariniplasma anaerobium TaxID=2735436 RepID=A0A7U9TKW0_9MOLU|nr:hypothetical protein [Mariniplasma anaerobium]BCR36659.1 hypothetical protein MPAN_015520 [Mariniplasma anaerobium]
MNLWVIIIALNAILSAILMSRVQKKKKRMLLLSIAFLLLIYKITEYTIYGLNLEIGKIPIEFSTLSYFLFGITILFHIKTFYPVAAFASFISGIGYLIAFIFIGEQYVLVNGLYTTIVSFTSHFILFFGSILLKSFFEIKKEHIKYILIYTVIYLIYVIIVNSFVNLDNSFLFIQILLKADILAYLMPSQATDGFAYFIYYFSIFMIYRLTLSIFYKIFKHHKRNQEAFDEYSI